MSLTYVSSTGALSSSSAAVGKSSLDQTIYNFTAADFAQKKEAYAQTKAMAELALLAADLPSLNIVRPSAISSHSTTGFTNTSDWTVLLAMTCKYAVKGTVAGANVMLNCVPVDYVCDILASIIVHESCFHSSGDGHASSISSNGHGPKQFNITQMGPPVSVFIAEDVLHVPAKDLSSWRMRLQHAALEKYDSTPFATDFPTSDPTVLQARKKFLRSLTAVRDWMMKYPFITLAAAGTACTASTEKFLAELSATRPCPSAAVTIDSVALMLTYLQLYFGAVDQ